MLLGNSETVCNSELVNFLADENIKTVSVQVVNGVRIKKKKKRILSICILS